MSVTLHTDVGDIKIELFCEVVPRACETGDPTGTGGTSIWNKKFPDEIVSTLKHDSRGVVCMANSGPDTNESQFYITFSPQAQLDNKYTIFGKVIHGTNTTMDIIENLEVIDEEEYRPLTEVRIKDVTIHANPIAEKDY